MKKSFNLEIKSPCEEKFNEMTPNASGSFCSSCAKNVIDLSTKTNSEIAKFISHSKDKNNICARLKTSQLEQQFELNETSKITNFKYAVTVAATVLLTSNVVGQQKEPIKTEIGCVKANPHVVGKIAYQETKMVSFAITGKISEKNTKKPLSNKKYPELTIFVSGSNVSVKVDPKTGAYSIPVVLDKKTSEIYVTINSNDSSYSKNMTIDLSKIQNNKLILNLTIDSEKEMHNNMIMGGLGVNFIDNKKIKNS